MSTVFTFPFFSRPALPYHWIWLFPQPSFLRFDIPFLVPDRLYWLSGWYKFTESYINSVKRRQKRLDFHYKRGNHLVQKHSSEERLYQQQCYYNMAPADTSLLVSLKCWLEQTKIPSLLNQGWAIITKWRVPTFSIGQRVIFSVIHCKQRNFASELVFSLSPVKFSPSGRSTDSAVCCGQL